VGPEGDARHRLTTSEPSRIIVVEEGKSKGSRREQAAQFTAAAIRADRWDFRSLGTTLASPYLAAGRLAAYVVFWASAIHTAAGSPLITEAGGTVSDIDGRPWTIDSAIPPEAGRERGDPSERGRPPSRRCSGRTPGPSRLVRLRHGPPRTEG
jgi:fructose-1,6-bisphosphatase/inositol monophosphatase family enzyme